MARTKRGVISKAKHKKVFKAVKGQYGRRKNTIRVARKAMEKASPVNRLMSEKKPRELISGRFGARSEIVKDSKVDTCHPANFWRRK